MHRKCDCMFKNEEQLKSFLKKEAKKLNISVPNAYTTYFSKILLERVSNYSYDELFVKGSFSEMAHLHEMIRPVTDIDLVSTKYHNDPLLILYQAMYNTNDNLFYELPSIPTKTKTGIYKINIVANFGKIKHPISIDFQELSNTIYEKEYKAVDPIFDDDKKFYIWTPSYEEHLAEKLCIVAESNREDILNTRVKDFYDIYKLKGGKYDYERLSYFFYHMLKDRNKIDISKVSTSHLDKDYVNKHSKLWERMSEKYDFLDKSVDFEESVEVTKEMLEGQINKLPESKKLIITLR